MKFKTIAASLSLLACSAAASTASASGLYVSDRGVRPMGRGGAFVAGADDLGATWYNPAGIADAGSAFLLDFAWVNFTADYTRQLRIQNPDGTIQYPRSPQVHGNTSFLPLPTIVISHAFGAEKKWTLAAGVLAPYVALTSFPDTVDGQPSPARYAMGSFNGSLMAIPGVWASWKPFKQLRFGVGVMALVGTFKTTVTFSTSPATSVLSPPEDPSYDAAAQLSAGPIFAPAANAGIIYVPDEAIRFGISGQGPMVISAPAHLDLRMPSAATFANATQDGNDAHIHFVLPAILRGGIEVRPARGVRVEAAYVREFWSEQKSIDIDMKGISLDNVAGGALSSKIAIPNIQFPRNFQDSNSFRLGGEFRYTIAGYQLETRAGVSYDTSGVPRDYLSVSSLDFRKLIPTLGGSMYIGKKWRFDAMFAHIIDWSTYVNPNEAQIQRINPISGNATYAPVNGGWYSASANILGVGINYKFD